MPDFWRIHLDFNRHAFVSSINLWLANELFTTVTNQPPCTTELNIWDPLVKKQVRYGCATGMNLVDELKLQGFWCVCFLTFLHNVWSQNFLNVIQNLKIQQSYWQELKILYLAVAICWYCQHLSEKKEIVQYEAKEKIMKKHEHIFLSWLHFVFWFKERFFFFLFYNVNTNFCSPISGHKTFKHARRTWAKNGEKPADLSSKANEMTTESRSRETWRWKRKSTMRLGSVIHRGVKQEKKYQPGCTPGRFAWLVWHLTLLSLYTELITVMQRAQFYFNKARERQTERGEINKTLGKQR